MRVYKITLATIGSCKPYTATFNVTAQNLQKAEQQALNMDFDTLHWTNDLGDETPWNDIDCHDSEVVIAHSSAVNR